SVLHQAEPALSTPPHTLLSLRMLPPPPRSTLFPYTTLFRSRRRRANAVSARPARALLPAVPRQDRAARARLRSRTKPADPAPGRSEEHTSELQSPYDLVCRLLLEKKKITKLQDQWPGVRPRE